MQVQTVDLRVSTSKIANNSNRLFCRLDGLTPSLREQQRNVLIKSLGLLDPESVPIFDEATQTAARFIEAPICILGLMVHDQLWLKSAVGLSQLGLMNQLATSRNIPRQEAFCTFVVDSHQPLRIDDTLVETIFSRSILTQHYGIRSYLGTPLLTAEGKCIGALAVMDLSAREFSVRDAEFLTLTARWCLREFERNHLLKNHHAADEKWLFTGQNSEISPVKISSSNGTKPPAIHSTSINSVKLKLLRQLTQELRTPLTAVIGMSSVLRGEVFGSLTDKQKEYLDIVHNSGQHLNSLVEEILKLGSVEEETNRLELSSVNVEMVCQQVINSLAILAQQKRQQLRLSVEPGKRIWLLDKEKVRQMLYYLVLSVMELAKLEGEIRIHVSRKNKTLNIAIWASHPWLGDGLPQVALYSPAGQHRLQDDLPIPSYTGDRPDYSLSGHQVISSSSLELALCQPHGSLEASAPTSATQSNLSLLLACYLAERHGGKVVVQGGAESGSRYVVMLPKIAAEESAQSE